MVRTERALLDTGELTDRAPSARRLRWSAARAWRTSLFTISSRKRPASSMRATNSRSCNLASIGRFAGIETLPDMSCASDTSCDNFLAKNENDDTIIPDE